MDLIWKGGDYRHMGPETAIKAPLRRHLTMVVPWKISCEKGCLQNHSRAQKQETQSKAGVQTLKYICQVRVCPPSTAFLLVFGLALSIPSCQADPPTMFGFIEGES